MTSRLPADTSHWHFGHVSDLSRQFENPLSSEQELPVTFVPRKLSWMFQVIVRLIVGYRDVLVMSDQTSYPNGRENSAEKFSLPMLLPELPATILESLIDNVDG